MESSRRAGDPASLVADSPRARSQLGWKPMFDDLDAIVEHAWAWEGSVSLVDIKLMAFG